MRNASQIRTDRPGLWSPHRSRLPQRRQGLRNAMALPLRVRQRKDRDRQEFDSRSNALVRLQAGRSKRCRAGWTSAARQIRVCFSLAWNDGNASLHHLAEHEGPLQQPEQRRLPQLWRSRHSSLRRVVQQFRSVLPRYVANLASRLNDRQDRYKRQLRTRQLPLASKLGAMEDAPLTWSKAR